MSEESGDRSAHFAAIESKHGEPVAHWLSLLETSGHSSYPAQMAFLREGHGFSRTHANAVVMWFRGSHSSQRFDRPEQYFESLDTEKAETIQRIFATIVAEHPELELVIAWNQPMLRCGNSYVVGVSASKGHLTINPFSDAALVSAEEFLSDLTVNKHTFQVPVDWHVDAHLLRVLVTARLAEIDAD
jgi:uncharacterized protein YdhG (YjbR/CyaY superfamily)